METLIDYFFTFIWQLLKFYFLDDQPGTDLLTLHISDIFFKFYDLLRPNVSSIYSTCELTHTFSFWW